MTIYYLMVKTHNITGLKYLCQTKRKDPHKYLGSGKYWKLHLKKHGKDIRTEILNECQCKPDLAKWGTYYSKLWDVVNSKEWANLRPETGDGAMPGTVRTTEAIVKGIETRRKNGTLIPSDETRAKMRESRGHQEPMTIASINKMRHTILSDSSRFERAKKAAQTRKENGYEQSKESLAKGVETRRKNGTLSNTKETVDKIVATRRINNSYNNSPESIAKMVATRKDNGSYKRTPESIAKQQATRLANRLLRNQDKT